jgi:hypothetical protein
MIGNEEAGDSIYDLLTKQDCSHSGYRVGRLLMHDIQQLQGPLTPTEASRMVSLARLHLQGEVVGSAQLPM